MLGIESPQETIFISLKSPNYLRGAHPYSALCRLRTERQQNSEEMKHKRGETSQAACDDELRIQHTLARGELRANNGRERAVGRVCWWTGRSSVLI
jgi:hypothetical protein